MPGIGSIDEYLHQDDYLEALHIEDFMEGRQIQTGQVANPKLSQSQVCARCVGYNT
jgi:hypothetical protein